MIVSRIPTRRRAALALIAASLLLGLAPRARAEESTHDVVVVGGGPGGLVAAMSAAHELGSSSAFREAGRKPRVLVVEKRGALPKGLKDFHDGDRLADTAFAREQVVGLKPSMLAKLEKLGFRLPNRYRAHSGRGGTPPPEARARRRPLVQRMAKEPSTHVIAINELQARLADHARKMGVEIRFDTGLEKIDPARGERVTLTVRGKSGTARRLTSRWVVGADGAKSKTRELAGLSQKDGGRQGFMVGAWFEGLRGANRNFYGRLEKPGGGVLMSDREQFYGLFALPRRLGTVLESAKKADRELTESEKANIRQHVRGAARRLLPKGHDGRGRFKVGHFLSFPIDLKRAQKTYSQKHRTIIVGDAVQTVNPYTGLGANVAMSTGLLAGKTLRRAHGRGRGRGRTRALRAYDRIARQAARDAHHLSDSYRSAFERRSAERARPVRDRLRKGTKSRRYRASRYRSGAADKARIKKRGRAQGRVRGRARGR